MALRKLLWISFFIRPLPCFAFGYAGHGRSLRTATVSCIARRAKHGNCSILIACMKCMVNQSLLMQRLRYHFMR